MATFNININEIDEGNVLGETVAIDDLVYLSTDNKWYKTTATLPSKSTTEIRIAMEAGIVDDVIRMLVYGYQVFTSLIIIPGSKYYISTVTGDITTQLYINTNNTIRYIGTGYDSTTLLFNPDQTYITENGTKINDVPINLTHSHGGDVFGSSDLTIAVDAVDIPMLSATGTPNINTYLRGDNVWATITSGGGGDVNKVGTPIDNQIGVWTGDGTIEGTTKLKWNNTTSALQLESTTNSAVLEIDGSTILSFNPGSSLLQLFENTLEIEESLNVTLHSADLFIYNTINDGNPFLDLGVSSTETLRIQSFYNVGTQVLDRIDFTTKTGSSIANDGRFNFLVDEVQKLGINDSGIDIIGNISVSGTVDGIDIATDVAANTLKITNAIHTGDVTGSTVLTIAENAVNIPMLSATGTPSATTFLRGDNTWSTLLGLQNIVEDLTPQLGANLDAQNFNITNLNFIYPSNVEFDIAGGEGLRTGGSGNNFFKGYVGRWDSDVILKYTSDLSGSYDDRTLIDRGYLNTNSTIREKFTLSSAQILTLFSSPVELISSPGVGKMISVINAVFSLNFNTIAYTGKPINISFSTGTGYIFESNILSNTSNIIEKGINFGVTELFSNNAIVATISGGPDPATGNSTVDIYITYEIITL